MGTTLDCTEHLEGATFGVTALGYNIPASMGDV